MTEVVRVKVRVIDVKNVPGKILKNVKKRKKRGKNKKNVLRR